MKITKNNLVSEEGEEEVEEEEEEKEARDRNSEKMRNFKRLKNNKEIFKIKGKTHIKKTNPSLLLEVEISSLVVTFK